MAGGAAFASSSGTGGGKTGVGKRRSLGYMLIACTCARGAAAGPGIRPGGPPLITRQAQVAPLVLAALGG